MIGQFVIELCVRETSQLGILEESKNNACGLFADQSGKSKAMR